MTKHQQRLALTLQAAGFFGVDKSVMLSLYEYGCAARYEGRGEYWVLLRAAGWPGGYVFAWVDRGDLESLTAEDAQRWGTGADWPAVTTAERIRAFCALRSYDIPEHQPPADVIDAAEDVAERTEFFVSEAAERVVPVEDEGDTVAFERLSHASDGSYMQLDHIVSEIKGDSFVPSNSDGTGWLSTLDVRHDREFFEQGIRKSRSLHINVARTRPHLLDVAHPHDGRVRRVIYQLAGIVRPGHRYESLALDPDAEIA